MWPLNLSCFWSNAMKVTIRFRPYFRDPMLKGVKLMTCRTKRMGNAGDTFEAFGKTFVLTHVMRMRLGYVIADCFEQEGCSSVQQLMYIWNEIHPGKGVYPEQIVWAHCFKVVET
jgi:hypothetical protein